MSKTENADRSKPGVSGSWYTWRESSENQFCLFHHPPFLDPEISWVGSVRLIETKTINQTKTPNSQEPNFQCKNQLTPTPPGMPRLLVRRALPTFPTSWLKTRGWWHVTRASLWFVSSWSCRYACTSHAEWSNSWRSPCHSQCPQPEKIPGEWEARQWEAHWALALAMG